jgi:hypothetical protein
VQRALERQPGGERQRLQRVVGERGVAPQSPRDHVMPRGCQSLERLAAERGSGRVGAVVAHSRLRPEPCLDSFCSRPQAEVEILAVEED